jgi:hypothetical protein
MQDQWLLSLKSSSGPLRFQQRSRLLLRDEQLQVQEDKTGEERCVIWPNEYHNYYSPSRAQIQATTRVVWFEVIYLQCP